MSSELTRCSSTETELGREPLAAGERSLCGWGRVRPSRARVLRPRAVDDVVETLAEPARHRAGVIARGAGRSYGDAAQRAGGQVLDMTGWNRVLSIDGGRGLITAQAGATIAAMMDALGARGLTLPVVPGTRHVTLAGAIAADVHGKNHHRDGSLARHVSELVLCTPAQGLLAPSPARNPELFYATLGGMGLTGVIVQATLRTEPLTSRWVATDVDRTDGLEQTLELMLGGADRSRYSVAWLDLLASGPRFGRAVLTRAEPLAVESAPRRARGRSARWASDRTALSRRPALEVPRGFPAGLLRPGGVRMFNRLHWRRAPRRERGRPVALAPYFFPLDGLGDWNRLYGAAGLVQYQFAIPSGQETALMRCFETIRLLRLPIYLAVFKRLGPHFGGPLSFPLAGWTLALDMPAATPGLRAALDTLDELVAGCGGRVYLAKDVRMGPESLRAMYPRLDRFESLCGRVDPDGVLGSDLSRRLGLDRTAR